MELNHSGELHYFWDGPLTNIIILYYIKISSPPLFYVLVAPLRVKPQLGKLSDALPEYYN